MMAKLEISSYDPFTPSRRWQHPARFAAIAFVVLLTLVHLDFDVGHLFQHESRYSQFERCSIRNMLANGTSAIDAAKPIELDEFVERRDRLARALTEEHIDAFIVEPGYTFEYYANISQTEWEPWEPEERPFLMVIQPFLNPVSGKIQAATSFLVPKFEAERARLLDMPFPDPLQMVTWEEHWNPYQTLLFAKFSHTFFPRVMLDEEMRDFIQRGLSSIGFQTVGLGGAVERVRQTKSAREISILKAVNRGTTEAIRQMSKCMVPGLTENEVRRALDSTLYIAGLEPFFDLVLFDEDASNPHGGTDGTKELQDDTLVLIDVGAHLHGYSSDVTRTFFPPFTPKCSQKIERKLWVWNVVNDAQTASIEAFRENNTAAQVDLAARDVITKAGYGDKFTHRLGHGIGIKAHESPYLNKGNTETILHSGMTFTTEPGIYLVDEFGVRLEDVYLITDDEAECLSCPRAQDAWAP